MADKIIKEGRFFYVKGSDITSTKTGAGLRGFMNARKLIFRRVK
jgi:hypothetical protein